MMNNTTRQTTRTIYPDGIVPADFNSWINHVQKELFLIRKKNAGIEFDLINARGDERKVLSLPVRWVENYSQQTIRS